MLQFPLASPLVVVGKKGAQSFWRAMFARHDEDSETAAAEAKRAERCHKAEL
jgi:hypothetical protein